MDQELNSTINKYSLFLQILVAVALLAVANADEDVPTILRNEQSVNADGTYQYAYETSNGIAAEEQGSLKNVGTDAEAIVSNIANSINYDILNDDNSEIQQKYP